MWYAWIIKAAAWVAQNWKAVGIGVLVLALASYIGALKLEIGLKEGEIADKAAEMVDLELQLARCGDAVNTQNSRIDQFKQEVSLRNRLAGEATERANQIQRESLEKDRELARLRVEAVSCDDAIIELGKMLGGVKWRK